MRIRGAARDRGGGTLYALALGLVFVLTGSAIAVQGTQLVAQQEAQTAADLGALAGAARAVEGGAAACDRAGAIAAANGASVVSCQLDGLDLELTVSSQGLVRAVEATARAGPVRISADDG